MESCQGRGRKESSEAWKMKVMNIIHDSVVDGEGLRSVVFFAGCTHHCKGCHNPESWNDRNGKEMNIDEIYQELMSNSLTDVTFSGGEPFMQADQLVMLASLLKDRGKNIWIYSGFTIDEILIHPNKSYQKLLSVCDVLVDGKFEMDKRDTTLPFRGSTNQRIISLQEY